MDKTAVITGASSGIGRSLALQLARVGYRVVLAARTKTKLDAVGDEIRDLGGQHLIVPTDLTLPEEIADLQKKALEFGNVAVVINNAGVGKFAPVEEISLEDWDLQMNVNLRGAFLVSRAFTPHMKKNKRGVIVFINSVAGKQPFANSAAYVSSKYGMRGLASSMREELQNDHIKVISIHPGAVNTPYWDMVDAGFPREEMLDSDTLAESIVQTIQAPGNLTVEEMVVRRIGGDF